MLAILNFLNAHNLPILQPILMILVSNSRFIELFLIKHTYYKGCCPLNKHNLESLRRLHRLV